MISTLNNESAELIIRRIIHEVVGEKQIPREHSLFSCKYDITPIDMVYIILKLEAETGIRISDVLEDSYQAFTISNLAEKLVPKSLSALS